MEEPALVGRRDRTSRVRSRQMGSDGVVGRDTSAATVVGRSFEQIAASFRSKP